MTAAQQLRYSYDDYLRALEVSALKLEYSAGLIYAMAGRTIAHGMLCANVIGVLRQLLRGRCVVMTADVKVRVESTDFAGFPDTSVVCGEILRSRIDENALTNPSVIVEVTSRSTEAYDRGEKLLHYQPLVSLSAVLLVSHRERRITVVERSENGWLTRECGPGEVLALREPACSMSLDEIYGGVALEPT